MVRKRETRRKVSTVGERVSMVVLSRYPGCRHQGGSGGVVRMCVDALVVEFRPSARPGKRRTDA